jgi:hypothetical protein
MSSVEFGRVAYDSQPEVDLDEVARENYTDIAQVFDEVYPPEYFTDVVEPDTSSLELAGLSQRLAKRVARDDSEAVFAVYRGLRFGEKLYNSLVMPADGTELDTSAFRALGGQQQRDAWQVGTEQYLDGRPSLDSFIRRESKLIAPLDTLESRDLTTRAAAFALMTAKPADARE